MSATDATLEDFALPEEERCINFEECRNPTPGANNSMCDDCLDRVRHADSPP